MKFKNVMIFILSLITVWIVVVFCVIYFFLCSNYFLFLIIAHFFVMNSLVGGF